MGGEPAFRIPAPGLPADVQAFLDAHKAHHVRQARLENEYSTSPVITVNGERVAWLNSPMLVSTADQEWVDRIRQQWRYQEQHDTTQGE